MIELADSRSDAGVQHWMSKDVSSGCTIFRKSQEGRGGRSGSVAAECCWMPGAVPEFK